MIGARSKLTSFFLSWGPHSYRCRRLMRWSVSLRQSATLKADPRQVKSFADAGVRSELIAALPQHISTPTGVQRKMLPLTYSGISVLARANVGTGKSLAAILSLASPMKGKLKNIVVVPTATLAEQYLDDIKSLHEHGSRTGAATSILYRTGEPAKDEIQHGSLKALTPSTLICTPTRLLDYLSHSPELVPLSALERLVVDEMDMFQGPEGKEVPFESLMAYLLQVSNPTMVLMSSLTNEKLSFSRLPKLLASKEAFRSILEVYEPERRSLTTRIRIYDASGSSSVVLTPGEAAPDLRIGPAKGSEKPASSHHSLPDYVAALQKMWTGDGVILIPQGLSAPKLCKLIEEKFEFLPLVAHAGDLAGLSIPGIEKLYILGFGEDVNLEKLSWALMSDRGSETPEINISLLGTSVAELDRLKDQLSALSVVRHE